MSTAGVPWPAGFPFRPMRQGFRRAREDDKVRFKPELGDAMTRPRHTAQTSIYAMVVPNLSRAQLATLHDYYIVTLGQGSLPLLLPEDPVTGAAADFKFESSIEDSPSGSTDDDGNDTWNASFVLRKLP